MELYLKRCAKFILCASEYFLMMDWTRHSVSAGGFLEPPPKYTSYSIFRRRTVSSRRLISSSTVTNHLAAPGGGPSEQLGKARPWGVCRESRNIPQKEGFSSNTEGLFPGAGGHFLDHGQHQLAVAVVEVGGVAPHLAEEAHLVLAELRQVAGVAVVARLVGEELRQRQLHGAGDLGQGVERGNGVAVLHPRKIAAQQARTLLDVALRHAPLQAEASDGLANIHLDDAVYPGRWLHSKQSRTVWQGEFFFRAGATIFLRGALPRRPDRVPCKSLQRLDFP